MSHLVIKRARGTDHQFWWFALSGLLLLGAMISGLMIGPAGPTWWRIPLELINRLPLFSVGPPMPNFYI